jgi:hypothetical protein
MKYVNNKMLDGVLYLISLLILSQAILLRIKEGSAGWLIIPATFASLYVVFSIVSSFMHRGERK